jgi:hypothetical protein
MHASLVKTLINYGRKKFYKIGPWKAPRRGQHHLKDVVHEKLECLSLGLYHKTYYGRNLQFL